MAARRAIPRRLLSSKAPLRAGLSELRNLIIIAHIDSGKSTLTDRLLHITGAVSPTQIAARAQYLDSNPIERARQITIKARAATLTWKNSSITLIDCPGHHDFSRQVLQTARAVEGALLLLDATQGVQAQTLTSVDHALHAGLELLPVINKIDLPTADVPMAKRQLEELIGLDGDDALLVSAKHGTGVPELLDAVTERLPTPLGNASDPLQAFVFDSYYDVYRGVVLLIRLINGTLRVGDVITPMSSASTSEASEYTVDQVGVLLPDEVSCAELRAGDIGFVTASVKRLADIPLGDTLTHVQQPALEPLARYEDPTPLVFCGLYPTDNSDANELRYALERLQLQDASVVFEPHVSDALGTGFRCGFLGLLHMAVTQERLEAEFGLSLISSAPSVSYKIRENEEEEWRLVSNPAMIPKGQVKIQEPFAEVELICQQEHVGTLIELAQGRRGEFKDQRHLGLDRVKLIYSLPLMELVTDFHDAVKSRTSGYASMSYNIEEMRESKLRRMDIHIAGEIVDGLSCVVHEGQAYSHGRRIVAKLREVIPRQMFKVAVQAVIGSKVIASEHIAPFRKDVTAKCYGGDASRKKKLLKKQAEGKKRMKNVGKVSIPQDAFMAVLGAQEK